MTEVGGLLGCCVMQYVGRTVRFLRIKRKFIKFRTEGRALLLSSFSHWVSAYRAFLSLILKRARSYWRRRANIFYPQPWLVNTNGLILLRNLSMPFTSWSQIMEVFSQNYSPSKSPRTLWFQLTHTHLSNVLFIKDELPDGIIHTSVGIGPGLNLPRHSAKIRTE
jgi:hypothetical protein